MLYFAYEGRRRKFSDALEKGYLDILTVRFVFKAPSDALPEKMTVQDGS